jgi:hypothetical protein
MMPFFRRSRRTQEEVHEPTTAEIREQRAKEWDHTFDGLADLAEYRKAFLVHSPLPWDILQSTQQDLLRLLVGRVPADLGVPAIFGLTVLFSHHPKPDDAAFAILSTTINELPPAHVKAVLTALSEAWHEAQQLPYEQRGAAVVGRLQQALERLVPASEHSGTIEYLIQQITQMDRDD